MFIYTNNNNIVYITNEAFRRISDMHYAYVSIKMEGADVIFT
jgi:hypothetical protein